MQLIHQSIAETKKSSQLSFTAERMELLKNLDSIKTNIA